MEIYVSNRDDMNILTGVLVRNGYVVSAQPLATDRNAWVIKTHDIKECSEEEDFIKG